MMTCDSFNETPDLVGLVLAALYLIACNQLLWGKGRLVGVI